MMGELEGGFSQLLKIFIEVIFFTNSLSNPLLISVPEEKEFLDPGNKITILGTELQLSSIRNELRFVKRSQKSRETVSKYVAEMQRPTLTQSREESRTHDNHYQSRSLTKKNSLLTEGSQIQANGDSGRTGQHSRSSGSQRTSAREPIDLTPLDSGIYMPPASPSKMPQTPHCV